MAAILIFMVLIAAIAFLWLSRQGLATKPWLEVGVTGEVGAKRLHALPAVKLGLGVFLAVAGSLFALLVSAYSMRMAAADWRAPPVPKILWLSTVLLVLASAALQMAVTAARRGDIGGVRSSLLAGCVSSLAFLTGQALAWGELAASGYFDAANPAVAFFCLLTAIHGLHVLGGLVALGRTSAKAFAEAGGDSRAVPDDLRLGVELCAIYWHFLLFVWLVLFSLLMPWAADLVAFCRALVT